MKKQKLKATIFLTFSFWFLICGSYGTFAATPQELRDNIEKKSQELEALKGQILSTQEQLETTKSQKQTLGSELNQIKVNLNQLDLGIKSSQTAIEKTGLEIEMTQYDIKDSEDKIKAKREVIAEILRQLQQKNATENPLTIFLKNKNLADSVFEIQGLLDFQGKLVSEIDDLRNLKEELDRNLQIASDKKQQKETENENLKNKKLIAEETKKYRQSLLEQTKNKEKIYQQSLTELQKKQDQIGQELQKLEEEMRLKIDRSILPKARPGVLAMPVGGTTTQIYGYTKFALAGGYKGKPHNGIDVAAPIGTPIFAAEKGKVISVGNQDLYCYKGAYGKFIAIEHENNLTTLYGHLSLQVVKEGDTVERGSLIGYVGKTGYAKGAHLHFGVYASQTFRIGSANLNCGPKMPYGGSLDPMDYL